MQTLYITHPAYRLHEMGAGHPESPDRLDAITAALDKAGLLPLLQEKEARLATDDDLLRVHTAQYLAEILAASPAEGYCALDADTVMNPHSLLAARAAAGAGLTAVDLIMAGEANKAFCSVRPPGHHACSDRAMGFCIFNNLAVTVAYTLEKYKLKRIAIIDFDVHHGNGTEEIFKDNENILMCSFFQFPLYPGVHAINNQKNMLNIALQPNSSGEDARKVVSDYWLPRLEAYQPEMFFISAGFDAHADDGLAQLNLLEDDYAWISDQLLNIADRTAGGRVVSFLEGGYTLSALGRSVAAHIRSLAR